MNYWCGHISSKKERRSGLESCWWIRVATGDMRKWITSLIGLDRVCGYDTLGIDKNKRYI